MEYVGDTACNTPTKKRIAGCGRGNRRGRTSHDHSGFTQLTGGADKFYGLGNETRRSAEGSYVDELVVMMLVVVVVLVVLCGESGREHQPSEQRSCGEYHQESGFHDASPLFFLYRARSFLWPSARPGERYTFL